MAKTIISYISFTTAIFLLILAGLFVNYLSRKQANSNISTPLKQYLNLPQSLSKIHIDFRNKNSSSTRSFNLPEDSKGVYYELSNKGDDTITPEIIINNQDWTSTQAIVNSIIDPRSTDRQKAIKIWQFVVNNHYHDDPAHPYDSEYSPVKYFNIWGYGYCGNSSYAIALLAKHANLNSRIVDLMWDHSVAEVYYDDGWHMFDADGEIYYENQNDNIVSVDDIKNSPNLLETKTSQIYSSPDLREKYQKNTRITTITNDIFASSVYKISYMLRPKEKIRFYYNYPGKYFKDKTNPAIKGSPWEHRPPRKFTNGFLITPISRNFFQPTIIDVTLPYPIVGSYITAPKLCKKNTSFLFSSDGEEWQPVYSPCASDVIDLSSFFTTRSGNPNHQYHLKTEPANWQDLTLVSQFQVAPLSLPQLKPGQNTINAKNISQEKLEITFGLN